MYAACASTLTLTAGLALLLAQAGTGAEEASRTPVTPPEWAWTARMAARAVELTESPEEIEALADQLQREGYTVFTVHPGDLTYDVLSYADPAHDAFLRRLADACHARGIRVVLKTMTLWHDKQRFPQYEATAGRHAGGTPTSYHLPPRPGSRAWYSCINHPQIRRAHLEGLPRLLAATGIDGFMTDALIRPDMTACACEFCRRTFEADTGFRMPDDETPEFWGNADNPAYRAWLLWRFRSVSDFLADVNAALQAMDPPRWLIEYYAPGIPSMLTSATDHEVLLDAGAAMIGQEIGVGPASQYNWRYMLAKLRHVQSLCERHGRVPYAIVHNTYAQSCPSLFRAMCWASGLRKWEYPEAYGAVRGLTVSPAARRWDCEHEDLLARVDGPATVALVYSRSSYVLVKGANRGGHGRPDPADGEYFGWARMLIEDSIPYDSLVDGELRPEVLARYRVLILPNVACMSPEACAAVRGFVESGGRLIATGLTSLYDATGARRDAPALADLLGAATAVHFPGDPGLDSAHIVLGLGSSGGQWQAPPGRESRRAMRAALGGDLDAPLRAADLPPGVVASLLRQRTEDGERLLVHLLNLRCTEVEPDGAEIARGCEVVYPLVRGPLAVDVRADRPCHAYMISPDFPGTRPVPTRATGNYVRLLVPELTRYALVVVETGEAEPPAAEPAPEPSHGRRVPGADMAFHPPWQLVGAVDRPIGSRPTRALGFLLPDEPVRAGARVNVALSVGPPADELRWWQADLCVDEAGAQGRLAMVVLIDGREVARTELLGDGAWVERRCALPPAGAGPQHIVFRIEALVDGRIGAPVQLWWARPTLWRDGQMVCELALPDPGRGAG